MILSMCPICGHKTLRFLRKTYIGTEHICKCGVFVLRKKGEKKDETWGGTKYKVIKGKVA
jgi:hypothetical protein